MYSPHRSVQKAHYLFINIFGQGIRKYLCQGTEFLSLLLGTVGTNSSSIFNACNTMGEPDDLRDPCQYSVLKRAWFSQYTIELTCIYEENIVHPH